MRRALRWLGVLLVAAFAGAVGFAVWLLRPGAPPPPLAPIVAQVETGRTEGGVSWMHGIGPRNFGPCIRVLAIDGGGTRGIIPALILQEIEKRTGQPIYRSFDLIAGTSTGAILALGLTRPSDADAREPAYTAADIVRFYEEHGAEIFPHWPPAVRALRRIFRPAYDVDTLEQIYATFFSDVRLQEALTNLLIPVYDIEDGRRVWFTALGTHSQVLMRELVRGATAAPTYLPPARIYTHARNPAKSAVAAVDGALFANNPAQTAFEAAQTLRAGNDKSVLLLSLGTGATRRPAKFEEAWGWGVLGWMDPLLEIAYSDPSIDHALRLVMEPKHTYVRLQPDLGSPAIALDDSAPATLARMREATRRYMSANAQELEYLLTMMALPRSPQCGPKVGADYERPEGPRPSAGTAKR
ncbi:MAG: patatin [Hyphomicrobiales bacterium]|nr:MAG: patatin [Hyphomicrobiales bacterium]